MPDKSAEIYRESDLSIHINCPIMSFRNSTNKAVKCYGSACGVWLVSVENPDLGRCGLIKI